MKTLLMTLLLAAGVSCAPPILLDPVPTTTLPMLETTTSLQTSEAMTTQVPTEEITTEQKQQTSTTTDMPEKVTTLEPAEDEGQEVTTVIPEQPEASTAAKELIAPTTIIPTTITPTTVTPTTVAPTTTVSTTAAPTTPEPPRISAKERESLISHLGNVDLTSVDSLVLTPRQRLAIAQELEYQQLGLAPFSDPTPWQRLSREQQEEFNRKYLALRPDLQQYSRNQFLSLPEERQAHAYGAFLSLDTETLSTIIESELQKEREVLEAERLAEERERQRLEQERLQQLEAQRLRNFQEQNTFQEQPRSQQRNNFNFNQIDQFRQRPKFDPRRFQQQQPAQQNQFQQRQFQPQQQNQFQQRHFQQQQQNHNKFQQQLSAAERLFFQQADAQLQEAIRLQGCLANPAACS